MSLELSEKAKNAVRELRGYYVFHPDFPKKGINFWDVFSLMKNKSSADLLYFVLEDYAKNYRGKVDVVVGLEARGFLFGPSLARMMNCGFAPIRKRGKLPGEVVEVAYALEYNKDVVQIQKNSIKSGQRVIIFDDCIATGGTLSASYNLVKKLGGDVVDCMVLYNIPEVASRINFSLTVLLA